MRRALLIGLVLALCASQAMAAAPKRYGIKNGWPLGPGQVGLVLRSLSLSSSGATVGSPFSATVQNNTSGSTLTLTNDVGGKYSLIGTTLSGAGLTLGTDAPAIQEAKTGYTNSPLTTVFSILVSAPSSGGQLDFSNSINSALILLVF